MKLDLMRVLAKNSESTASFLKPDIGPQSSPSARAAMFLEGNCGVLNEVVVDGADSCRVIRGRKANHSKSLST